MKTDTEKKDILSKAIPSPPVVLVRERRTIKKVKSERKFSAVMLNDACRCNQPECPAVCPSSSCFLGYLFVHMHTVLPFTTPFCREFDDYIENFLFSTSNALASSWNPMVVIPLVAAEPAPVRPVAARGLPVALVLLPAVALLGSESEGVG